MPRAVDEQAQEEQLEQERRNLRDRVAMLRALMQDYVAVVPLPIDATEITTLLDQLEPLIATPEAFAALSSTQRLLIHPKLNGIKPAVEEKVKQSWLGFAKEVLPQRTFEQKKSFEALRDEIGIALYQQWHSLARPLTNTFPDIMRVEGSLSLDPAVKPRDDGDVVRRLNSPASIMKQGHQILRNIYNELFTNARAEVPYLSALQQEQLVRWAYDYITLPSAYSNKDEKDKDNAFQVLALFAAVQRAEHALKNPRRQRLENYHDAALILRDYYLPSSSQEDPDTLGKQLAQQRDRIHRIENQLVKLKTVMRHRALKLVTQQRLLITEQEKHLNVIRTLLEKHTNDEFETFTEYLDSFRSRPPFSRAIREFGAQRSRLQEDLQAARNQNNQDGAHAIEQEITALEATTKETIIRCVTQELENIPEKQEQLDTLQQNLRGKNAQEAFEVFFKSFESLGGYDAHYEPIIALKLQQHELNNQLKRAQSAVQACESLLNNEPAPLQPRARVTAELHALEEEFKGKTITQEALKAYIRRVIAILQAAAPEAAEQTLYNYLQTASELALLYKPRPPIVSAHRNSQRGETILQVEQPVCHRITPEQYDQIKTIYATNGTQFGSGFSPWMGPESDDEDSMEAFLQPPQWFLELPEWEQNYLKTLFSVDGKGKECADKTTVERFLSRVPALYRKLSLANASLHTVIRNDGRTIDAFSQYRTGNMVNYEGPDSDLQDSARRNILQFLTVALSNSRSQPQPIIALESYLSPMTLIDRLRGKDNNKRMWKAHCAAVDELQDVLHALHIAASPKLQDFQPHERAQALFLYDGTQSTRRFLINNPRVIRCQQALGTALGQQTLSKMRDLLGVPGTQISEHSRPLVNLLLFAFRHKVTLLNSNHPLNQMREKPILMTGHHKRTYKALQQYFDNCPRGAFSREKYQLIAQALKEYKRVTYKAGSTHQVRQLFLSSLKTFIVTQMGGITQGSCQHGKDRTAVAKMHADAFFIYYKRHGKLPRYGEESKALRRDFVAIFVALFKTKHHQYFTQLNAPGSQGICNLKHVLPRDVYAVLKRDKHAVEEAKQLADINELRKFVKPTSKKRPRKPVRYAASQEHMTAHHCEQLRRHDDLTTPRTPRDNLHLTMQPLHQERVQRPARKPAKPSPVDAWKSTRRPSQQPQSRKPRRRVHNKKAIAEFVRLWEMRDAHNPHLLRMNDYGEIRFNTQPSPVPAR